MKKIAIVLGVLVCGVLMGLMPGQVMAANGHQASELDPACNAQQDPAVRAAAGCNDANADMGTVNGIMRGVLNTVIGFVAVIAVIIIVVAGINMSVSQGDPGKVAKARNMMIYAVIGLAVAILAFAIVNFVLARVF